MTIGHHLQGSNKPACHNGHGPSPLPAVISRSRFGFEAPECSFPRSLVGVPTVPRSLRRTPRDTFLHHRFSRYCPSCLTTDSVIIPRCRPHCQRQIHQNEARRLCNFLCVTVQKRQKKAVRQGQTSLPHGFSASYRLISGFSPEAPSNRGRTWSRKAST